jgi:hypothetical protein
LKPSDSTPAFAFTNIAYKRYSPSFTSSFLDHTPATLTLSFSVTNKESSIETACSFSNDLINQGG